MNVLSKVVHLTFHSIRTTVLAYAKNRNVRQDSFSIELLANVNVKQKPAKRTTGSITILVPVSVKRRIAH